MDIYEQAKLMNADYYEYQTGYIYKIQDYNKEKETNPDARIAVVDSLSGELLGYAKKKGEQ